MRAAQAARRFTTKLTPPSAVFWATTSSPSAVPVRRGLGFELGGQDVPKRQWAGATSTARTFWHGGFGSSVCWGDPDLGLAMAFLTNGVRRDEAGAIARRNLSDAVRASSR